MLIPVKRLHLLIIFLGFLLLAAVAIFTTTGRASADHHLVRINEVMAGLNGDSKVQYIVLEASSDSQKAWGPQPEDPAGSPGRAMLVFYNALGTESGRFVFPSDPANGADTVLVATAKFAALPGAPTPDFIMPADIIPVAGKVAFQNNPDNINSTSVNVALSYGGAGYSGSTAGADDGPNSAELPILNTAALTRVSGSGFGSGTQSNADFAMGPPNPLNTAGATFTIVPSVAPLADQGEILFNEETFLGNGRTCASCHVPDNGDFGLSPEQILNKPADDVLFVPEYNVNTLVVTSDAPSGFAQPSDLRGEISGTTGSATVLAGYGDTYLIYGGGGLSGNAVSTDDGANFELVLGDLRTELDALSIETGQDYEISIATAGGYEKLDNLNLEGIDKHVDFYNVMTYDFHGGWEGQTGHQAAMTGDANNYDITGAVQVFEDAGVDLSKVVMGAPAYTRAWGGVEDGGTFGYQQDGKGSDATGTFEAGVYDYKDIVTDVVTGQTSLYWDDDNKAAFVYDGNDEWSSMETTATIAGKAAYIEEKGLGGMMFWALSNDAEGELSLIEAADDLLRQGVSYEEVISRGPEFDYIVGGDGAFSMTDFTNLAVI